MPVANSVAIGRKKTISSPRGMRYSSPTSTSRLQSGEGGSVDHGPVAGHVSGTYSLMPAYQNFGFATLGARPYAGRCCMNTRCGWGGVARTSRDPPQEPHYGDEVEGSSHV